MLLAEVNKWARGNLSDLCLCVGYLHTLLSSSAAKITQQICCPTTQDCPTSGKGAGGADGEAVAAGGDFPVTGIPVFLRPFVSGLWLWEECGIRRRAWNCVLDSNPSTKNYISLPILSESPFLSSFLETFKKNTKYRDWVLLSQKDLCNSSRKIVTSVLTECQEAKRVALSHQL